MAACRQTPGLATAARNCDHIATIPHVIGGDRCPTRTGNMAIYQHQRGRRWMGRAGGGRRCMTTDLAVGGSNPSRRATITAAQRPRDGVAACYRDAGLRPNCDHVGGQFHNDCDHHHRSRRPSCCSAGRRC